jgi:branched-chain amino acid transport system ATP-binding protein
MVGAQEKREKIQYGYLGPMTEQNAFKSLEIADRGYVLESGKMVLSGSKSELYGHEDVRRAYLGI